MKMDLKTSSKWLLLLPFLMSICLFNAHAEAPPKDHRAVDKQLSQADPFGFGKLLKSKQGGSPSSVVSPIEPSLNLDSVCAKCSYYDETIANLENAFRRLKAAESSQDFQKQIAKMKDTLDCLKGKQKSLSAKVDDLSKQLSATHFDGANGKITAHDEPKSDQSFYAVFKSIAREVEQSDPIKTQGKAQNTLEYYKRAVRALSRLPSNQRVEAIQYLLKEANESALDGPIYKTKEAAVKILQSELENN